MAEKIITPPAKTGDTVTVACKTPNGIIMRVFKMVKASEQIMGGGSRDIEVAEPMGEPITIYGNRAPWGEQPKCEVVAGYALTRGVPKDFWELWVKQNEQHPLVVNKLIFAHSSDASSADEARDHSASRSGLEALVRDGKGNMIDSRIPKRIATADEQPKVPA